MSIEQTLAQLPKETLRYLDLLADRIVSSYSMENKSEGIVRRIMLFNIYCSTLDVWNRMGYDTSQYDTHLDQMRRKYLRR